MEKKKQFMRYTEEELNLIKKTFCDNDELLKIVRKVMLQMPLSTLEEKIRKDTFNPEMMAVMRKSFLPELDGEAPLNQVVDLWLTVQLADKLPEQALPIIQARKIVIDYIGQQLAVLSGASEDICFIRLKELVSLGNAFDVYTNLLARNTIIQHVENQLAMELKVLSQRKEGETEKIAKDSTK